MVDKENKKGQNTKVMKFNSRPLIHYLKTETAAVKWKRLNSINSETVSAPFMSHVKEDKDLS